MGPFKEIMGGRGRQKVGCADLCSGCSGWMFGQTAEGGVVQWVGEGLAHGQSRITLPSQLAGPTSRRLPGR